MKTKSPLLIAIALFVLVAFPNATARAACGQTADVYIYYEYGGPTGIQVKMQCWTAGAIIYFTLNGADPTRDDSGNPGANTLIYYGPYPVPYQQWRYFKARAWKPGIPCYYDSVNITDLYVSNPPQ